MHNKIWDIGWGIETRCNMNCEFCYSKEVRKADSKLGLDTYKKFIDKNGSEIHSINYGTGENSLSEEWFQFVEYIGINYPHIRQAITTNGNLSRACKDNKKQEIFEKYIDEVDISLDFANKERHNKFRGNPDAYDMAISSFDMCNKYGKKTTLVFLATNEVTNCNNLEGLFEIAHRYNAYLRSNIYRPTQGINSKSQKYILEYRALINMLQWISDNHKIIKMSDRLLAAILFNKKVEDYSGSSSLRILGDGSITPSTYLISDQYRKYNILDDINLNNITFEDTIGRTIVPEECSSCQYKNICKGGVYDRRLLWYGTLDERDPYCQMRNNDQEHHSIKLSNEVKFTSVHDSYLPTMFFAY